MTIKEPELASVYMLHFKFHVPMLMFQFQHMFMLYEKLPFLSLFLSSWGTDTRKYRQTFWLRYRYSYVGTNDSFARVYVTASAASDISTVHIHLKPWLDFLETY